MEVYTLLLTAFIMAVLISIVVALILQFMYSRQLEEVESALAEEHALELDRQWQWYITQLRHQEVKYLELAYEREQLLTSDITVDHTPGDGSGLPAPHHFDSPYEAIDFMSRVPGTHRLIVGKDGRATVELIHVQHEGE